MKICSPRAYDDATLNKLVMFKYINNAVIFPKEMQDKLLKSIMRDHIDEKLAPSTQPLFCFYSDSGMKYRYFRHEITSREFTQELIYLQSIAQILLKDNRDGDLDIAGKKYNVAFVNLYRSGNDYLPPHKDRTHCKYPIVSFSFYEDCFETADEDMRTLNMFEDDKESCIEMDHCSAVIMNDGKITHSVPRTKTEKYRINVTFRISD
jgi:alkylated DNA repair dioxygenase AlkB